MYKWLSYSFLFIGLLILIILGLVYWLKDNINRNVMYAFLGFGIGFFILGGILSYINYRVEDKIDYKYTKDMLNKYLEVLNGTKEVSGKELNRIKKFYNNKKEIIIEHPEEYSLNILVKAIYDKLNNKKKINVSDELVNEDKNFNKNEIIKEEVENKIVVMNKKKQKYEKIKRNNYHDTENPNLEYNKTNVDNLLKEINIINSEKIESLSQEELINLSNKINDIIRTPINVNTL